MSFVQRFHCICSAVNIGAVAGGVTVAGVVLLLTVLLVVVGVAVAVYKWRKRKDDLTISKTIRLDVSRTMQVM